MPKIKIRKRIKIKKKNRNESKESEGYNQYNTRRGIKKKEVSIKYCSSNDMIADYHTKPLLKKKLGICRTGSWTLFEQQECVDKYYKPYFIYTYILYVRRLLKRT